MAIFFGIVGVGEFVPFFVGIRGKGFGDVERDFCAGADAIADAFFGGLLGFAVGEDCSKLSQSWHTDGQSIYG